MNAAENYGQNILMHSNVKWRLLAEQLLQQSAEATLVFDSYLKIVEANDLFCNILKKEKAQIIGRGVDTFFPGLVSLNADNGQEQDSNYYSSSATRYEVKIKKIYATPGKLEGGILKLIQTIPDESGPVQPALVSYLLNQMPYGAAVFSNQGVIYSLNSLLLSYLNTEKESDVVGKNITDLLSGAFKQEFTVGLEQTLKGKPYNLSPLEILNHNGLVQVSFRPLTTEGNQVMGGLMVWQDLTPRLEKEAVGLNAKTWQKVKLETMLTIWITQIEERKRIAGKIHNSLGQLLYGFKMEFLKKGQILPAETRTYLTNLLNEAINETKVISFELMPAMLEDFGLEATLEELVKKHQTSTLKLSYHVSGILNRLDANLEILIYSVIQELLNNVVKHAKATKARIYLEQENGFITVKIIDNGNGFEKGKLIYALKSTGLRNIKNSLKLFNGQIKISSQIGKGSLVTVQIPLMQ